MIFIIFSLYCRLRRRDAQESGWFIGKWCRPRGPMPKIGSGGRSGAARPADRPVDARLKRPHNVPREGTSHILFPPSRRLRRPAAQESGGSNAGWYGPMGAMPFYRSRGRLTAGEASDRSGVVVRHTTTSLVLREGEYYATVSAHATFCSKVRLSYRQVARADGTDAADPVGRPTSGRKFGKLPPESPWQGGLEV